MVADEQMCKAGRCAKVEMLIMVRISIDILCAIVCVCVPEGVQSKRSKENFSTGKARPKKGWSARHRPHARPMVSGTSYLGIGVPLVGEIKING